MTRKTSSPARILSAIAFFLAASTPLVALIVLAQQKDRGQPSVKFTSASVGQSQIRKTVFSAALSAGVSFLPPVTYTSGGEQGGFVAVADINGDGKPDLIVANSYVSSSVSVLLGNGDGTFRSALTYPTGAGDPRTIIPIDVNGDGKLDLVTLDASPCYACSGNGLVSVLMGNGDGTFQPAVTYDSGGVANDDVGPAEMAVADVNGDGKLDIVVLNCAVTGSSDCNGDGVLGVLLGNGDGTFQSARTQDIGAPAAGGLAVADVNADGKPDVLVAVSAPAGLGVMLGNNDGTFQRNLIYPSGEAVALGLGAADLSGDGKIDVVLNGCGTSNCWQSNGTVSVFVNHGDGTFEQPVTYSSGNRIADGIAIADVNGDGKLDLVAVNIADQSVGVLLGNGDGTFQPALTFPTNLSLGYSVAVYDVNGDGKPDVLTSGVCSSYCADDGGVSVLLNASGAQNPTTTTLASLLNPSVFGEGVSFAATITSKSGMPTGTVQILNDSVVIGSGTLTSGSVSIPVSTLPAGPDSITASYLGSSSFAPSKSARLTQTVTKATTTTSLTSSLNLAGTNQPVTFAATVTSQYGGAATGNVSFMAGSQSLGTAAVNGGRSVLTTSFAAAGTYSITAQYNGDANNTGSTSGALSEKIIASTTTTLTSSLNPAAVGQAVTFTATVTSSGGAPPNGEAITFYNGTAVLGTVALTSGTAAITTSSLPAGIFTVTASYPGDSNFAASTSAALRQVVNSTTKSATSTSLTSGLNPSIYGQTVLFTATVSTTGPLPPSGTVAFSWTDGSRTFTIGRAALNSSGVATLVKSNLNADPYPMTAVYGGDTNNLGSVSPVLNQMVLPTTSAATLTASPNASTVGQSVTFTAKITSRTVLPTGPVTFTLGKMILGTVQLSGGKAAFATTSLPAGSNLVTATYNGDSNIKGSSAVVNQVVQP